MAAWMEARIACGLGATETNRQLRAAGAIRKETPGEFDRDIELGFTALMSVPPIERAPDLLDMRAQIGVASVFDAKTRRFIVSFDSEATAWL